METVYLRDDYIKLGQAMKAAGISGSGLDAKMAILDGHVMVNGKTETRRGRKLYKGDVVSFENQTFKIEKLQEL